MRSVHRLGVFAILLLATTAAHAASVTWIYSGAITEASSGNFAGITTGDTFSAAFTFDTAAVSAAADSAPEPYFGMWSLPISLTLKVTNGGATLLERSYSTNVGAQLGDDYPVSDLAIDALFMGGTRTQGTMASGNYVYQSMELLMRLVEQGSTASALTSPLWPSAPPDPTSFLTSTSRPGTERYFGFSESTVVDNALAQQLSLRGSLDKAELAPVPIPAAAWLMLSGLAGVAAFARRRRRAI